MIVNDQLDFIIGSNRCTVSVNYVTQNLFIFFVGRRHAAFKKEFHWFGRIAVISGVRVKVFVKLSFDVLVYITEFILIVD